MNIFPKILTSAAVLTAACLAAPAQDFPGKWAVVSLSANFMREAPDYAAELGDQALMGTVVEILDTSGYWVKIKSPEPYTAWVNELGLVPMGEKELRDYLEAPKYICTATLTHIFEEPSADSRPVTDLVLGDVVRILYKTQGGETGTQGTQSTRSTRTPKSTRPLRKDRAQGRPVLKRRFAGVVLPSGKIGYVPVKDVAVFRDWAADRKDRTLAGDDFRQDLLATGYRFLGVPYMWGGTSVKGVDCSGFTRSIYFANGVLLPRNASQQARVGEDVGLFSPGGNVDWSGLLPGDLLFWGRAATDSTKEKATHVGMYIGGGRFIHSSQIVRTGSLDPSAPDFYDRRPLRARRIVGHIDAPGSGIISTIRSPFYFPGSSTDF